LASGNNFLLGTWLAQAKDIAVNEEERRSYEYNARNQITLWGPNGEIRDYANKQWSGVVVDYFKLRWELFLKALEKSLVQRIEPNITEINNRIFHEVERSFTFSTKLYPVETKGIYLFIIIFREHYINNLFNRQRYFSFVLSASELLSALFRINFF